MSPTVARCGIDRTYSVLGDQYRRLVLRYLEGERNEVTRDELARELAGAVGQSKSTERMLMILHHVHLPKLADENAIRYEADEGVVTATRQTECFLEWLDSIEG